MNALRRVSCVLGFVLSVVASHANATSFSTDQSDLWYIAAESGWGMQLVQRGNVIFATLFVYGQDGSPTWYTATMDPTATPYQWTGTLYATTGPWFGTVPFNPMLVTIFPVGMMTWTAETVGTGNVAYSVNGAAVSKNVVRQTLVLDDFSGHYAGGAHAENSGCANPASNGIHEGAGLVYVEQTGTAITVQTIDAATRVSCSYAGTLSEAGQMGSVQGPFACSDGEAGTFLLFEMQVNISGITTRYQIEYTNPAGCATTGWFGGVRGTTF